MFSLLIASASLMFAPLSGASGRVVTASSNTIGSRAGCGSVVAVAVCGGVVGPAVGSVVGDAAVVGAVVGSGGVVVVGAVVGSVIAVDSGVGAVPGTRYQAQSSPRGGT